MKGANEPRSRTNSSHMRSKHAMIAASVRSIVGAPEPSAFALATSWTSDVIGGGLSTFRPHPVPVRGRQCQHINRVR